MKHILFLLLLLMFTKEGLADHISGGEVFYTVTDLNNGEYRYRITVKLFMVCNSGRQFNNPSMMSVFNKANGTRIKDIPVNLAYTETLSLSNNNKCITDPPTVCYQVGFYEFETTLPASADGYYITCQVVYRINGISNLVLNYGNIGATYTADIPGNASLANAAKNNSAKFIGDDMVVVCAFNSFSYSFGAIDNDGDELRYSFCDAYQGGSGGFGNNSSPPLPPPYSSVPYSSNFSGSLPLGNNVRIDSKTGLITGVAPSSGVYVVTVCVEEIRNGVVIAVQRKDLQINITSCSIASATIPPEYMLCKDTREISLANLSRSPLISTYNWELIDANGEILHTSTQATVNYLFKDTGVYKIKLVINRNGTCADSTVSIARVYPGFKPDFDFNGVCLSRPTQFVQKTSSQYGTVNMWDWDFGDNSMNDFSDLPSPSYNYSTLGNKEVRMVAGNSVGCIDTVRKIVSILDKPPLELLFKDTLICKDDAVQFGAAAPGKYSWSPQLHLDDAFSQTPVATPPRTMMYYVDVDDEGCANRDSVLVRVTDAVSMEIMEDTIACSGDPLRIHLKSNAFQYAWEPPDGLDNALLAQPITSINSTVTYNLTARLGGCMANADVTVQRVPYPMVNAGADTTICFNTTASLRGTTDGISFSWTPSATLVGGNTLNPLARPGSSMMYILSALADQGCPKPSRDTVLVKVLPQVEAYAGRDTAIVVGQPLQLTASGGIRYLWSPSTGLSTTTVADPIASFNSNADIRYLVQVFNEAGCIDTASVMVKVFTSKPEVFVPNAFTPNRDGRNDVFRVITAGIRQLEYIRVYNRWGQMVYSATNTEGGWDGTIAGKDVPSGTFVWMVKAIDFTGASYVKRGTLTLIR